VKIDDGAYWFRARYSGRCRVCDGPIAVGELLTRAWPVGYCHNVCPRSGNGPTGPGDAVDAMVDYIRRRPGKGARALNAVRDRQLVRRVQAREDGGSDAPS
jgi:hypothetical protein